MAELNSNEKRNLRNMLQSPGWTVFEKVLDEYKKTHFLDETAKKGTEFDTMWFIAHKEGGKEYLEGFMGHLSDKAHD